MNYIQTSALDFACKYNASEIQSKLSYWKGNPAGILPSQVRTMIKIFTMALEFKQMSPYHIAVSKEEVKKLPSHNVTVNDFNGVVDTDADHFIFIDKNTSKSLSEHGFSGCLHDGWNNIPIKKAEEFIPLLRGSLLSIKRKSVSKKIESFIEQLIWSYGCEFKDKWIKNTQVNLFCSSAVGCE